MHVQWSRVTAKFGRSVTTALVPYKSSTAKVGGEDYRNFNVEVLSS